MVDRIVLLDKQGGRTHFDCGNHALNVFLSDHAGQQQRRGVGKTYVTLRDGLPDILGFVTLCASATIPGPYFASWPLGCG